MKPLQPIQFLLLPAIHPLWASGCATQNLIAAGLARLALPEALQFRP
jgi:hypothetical protein